MKKKQWIIGIIIVGIIVAICAFSCSSNDDEYQSMEDETEFVPFPSEEDAEDENVSDDLEEGEKSSSDKTEEKNPVSDTVQNGNNTTSGTTENKNDKDSNATTDDEKQDSEDTRDTENNVDTELPFVPFS